MYVYYLASSQSQTDKWWKAYNNRIEHQIVNSVWWVKVAMAVSTTTTTTTTVCIPNNKKIHTPTKSNLGFSNRLTFTPKPRNLRITISNSSATSSDFSPEEDATTATQQADPDTAIEVPDQPPSLISALNVERALRGIRISFFLSSITYQFLVFNSWGG